MSNTPIYDQMQRESFGFRISEAMDNADAHTLMTQYGVMCA